MTLVPVGTVFFLRPCRRDGGAGRSVFGKNFSGKSGEGVFALGCFVGSLKLVVVVVVFMTYAHFITPDRHVGMIVLSVLYVNFVKPIVMQILKEGAISASSSAPAINQIIGTILTVGIVRLAPAHSDKQKAISAVSTAPAKVVLCSRTS